MKRRHLIASAAAATLDVVAAGVSLSLDPRTAAPGSTFNLTVSNTGTPCTWLPPLPPVTPATTLVPYSSICPVWKVPFFPVIPCTSRRVPSFTSIAIDDPLPAAALARWRSQL